MYHVEQLRLVVCVEPSVACSPTPPVLSHPTQSQRHAGAIHAVTSFDLSQSNGFAWGSCVPYFKLGCGLHNLRQGQSLQLTHHRRANRPALTLNNQQMFEHAKTVCGTFVEFANVPHTAPQEARWLIASVVPDNMRRVPPTVYGLLTS